MFAGSPDGCDEPQIMECLLEPGDLLFLPVGCWFFIETVETSTALMFTNFAFVNDFAVPDIVDGVL
jgi:hypothetical protein